MRQPMLQKLDSTVWSDKLKETGKRSCLKPSMMCSPIKTLRVWQRLKTLHCFQVKMKCNTCLYEKTLHRTENTVEKHFSARKMQSMLDVVQKFWVNWQDTFLERRTCRQHKLFSKLLRFKALPVDFYNTVLAQTTKISKLLTGYQANVETIMSKAIVYCNRRKINNVKTTK